jgi:YVTN family beta-propeller protein
MIPTAWASWASLALALGASAACSSGSASASGEVTDSGFDGARADAEGDAFAVPACETAPPPEATVRAGYQGAALVLPGGRVLTPFGVHQVIGGFPVDVRPHPNLDVAYVANTGYGNAHRSVQVVSTTNGGIRQEVVRSDSFYGIAVSADGRRLYASGGAAALVDVYAIGDDGKLTPDQQIAIGSYPAGIALSADGTRLWVGEFKGNAVVEIDAATLAPIRTIPIPFGAYGVLEVPERHELYVSGFAADQLAVVDVSAAVNPPVTTVVVGGNPLGMAQSPGGDRVFAAVSNGDVVVAVDTAERRVVARQAVGEPSIADSAGSPLPASSPGGIALSPSGDALFVARAADNAVSVLDPATLAPRGAIPVAWYPTGLAVTPDGKRLLVTNGKGVGTGPLPQYTSNNGKLAMHGSLSIVELAQADFARLGAQVEDNVRRPDRVYPFSCDKPFPIPIQPGDRSPIEHIVLVVRENKTYDSLLGDLGRGERDPSLVMYGEAVTPNLHALARAFTSHDNFYDDSETSVQGHLWLTSSFVNDYIERTWFEDYRNQPGWGADAISPQGRPSFLTFFTHLMKSAIDFRIYGEIVGVTDSVDGQDVSAHADSSYPGGPFINYDVHDADKARYVAQKLVDEGSFPPFVYVLFPNDHTKGFATGALSPESMIADNDEATGILVDRISHSPFWASTAIFIVEDDAQIGADHVDYHRSIHVVASPWAKRGYTSSVHTSFPSLFRTFEKILGIGPMNRYDALATPLWDAFRTAFDDTPFVALPRTTPDSVNPANTPLAALSDAMDWSGPDRNPDLGDLLFWGRFGAPPPGARIAHLTPAQLRAARGIADDD